MFLYTIVGNGASVQDTRGVEVYVGTPAARIYSR
jgi:hypothetical protein